MKIRHKFAATVISGIISGISLGVWGALLFHHEIHHRGLEKVISHTVLASVLVFGAVLTAFAIAFRKSFFRAISDIGSFTDQMGTGKVPEPLVMPRDGDIARLYSLLNYLCDRQQSMNGKLSSAIEREANLRREIEFYDSVLFSALNRLLSSAGQSLSIIKGLQLCTYEGSDLSDSEKRYYNIRSLRRIAALTREIDLGSDILYLDRDRVINRVETEFSTSTLYQELSDRCTRGLAPRKITLSGSYNAGAPGCLRADRELLSEILTLMLKTVGRITKTGGSVTFNVSGSGRKVIFEVGLTRDSENLEELAENYRKFKEQGDHAAVDAENATLNVLGLEIIRQIALFTGSPFTVSSDERFSTRLELVLECGFDTDPGKRGGSEYRSFSPALRGVEPSADDKTDERHHLRIMLADADEDECAVLKRLMKRENIELSTCLDEKNLLAAIGELPYDGVLLAPPFSGRNAPELIRKLRKESGWSRLPAVVISPYFSEELLYELNDLPRVKHLDMPLNYEQLAKVLHGRF